MPVGHHPLFHIQVELMKKNCCRSFFGKNSEGTKLLKDQKMIYHLLLLIFWIQDGKGEDGGAKDGIFTSNVDVQNLVTNLREIIPALKSYVRKEEMRIEKLRG